MAQLIWRTPYDTGKDEVQIAWEGKASECLAAALGFFVHSAIESNQRLAQMDDAPEVIRENARAIVERAAKGEFSLPFSVIQRQDGSYSIWISDGPDRYDLID